MKEKVFNLFLYVDKGIITQIGVTTHEITGSDKRKLDFMKNAVRSGFKKNVQFLVPSNFRVFVNGKTMQGITYETYIRMCFMGVEAELFQEIFEHYTTPGNPLFYVTHIINGLITEDARVSFAATDNSMILAQ